MTDSSSSPGLSYAHGVSATPLIGHNRSLDELPQAPEEVEKLARRLGYEVTPEDTAGGHFLSELERHTRTTRELFLRLLTRERERDMPARPS